MTNTPANSRLCSLCGKEQDRGSFSKTQWKKADSKCQTCTAANTVSALPAAKANTAVGASGSRKQTHLPPTPICLEARPQSPVPGFESENLTVCCDWPATKSGRPPNAQSLIFTPLLACVLGPIEGFCTQTQIEVAMQWWTCALPAWRRWVARYQQQETSSGVDLRDRLLRTAKGQPNALIPKTKGRGRVPHFNGRLQVEALEQVPDAAVQVYACVTCLYTAATTTDTRVTPDRRF